MHRNFSSVQSPVLSVPEATVERNDSPFNRKKPLAEPDSGRVAIRLDQLGFEKTEKRGGNTITPFKGYLLEQGNTS